nr:hypothetical protein SUGSMm_34570 [Morganella morganii subsp. sibonii]
MEINPLAVQNRKVREDEVLLFIRERFMFIAKQKGRTIVHPQCNIL